MIILSIYICDQLIIFHRLANTFERLNLKSKLNFELHWSIHVQCTYELIIFYIFERFYIDRNVYQYIRYQNNKLTELLLKNRTPSKAKHTRKITLLFGSIRLISNINDAPRIFSCLLRDHKISTFIVYITNRNIHSTVNHKDTKSYCNKKD